MKKRQLKASKISSGESAESIVKLIAILHYISAVFLGILGFLMIVLSSFFWSVVSGLIRIPLAFMIMISLFIFAFGVFQFFVAGGLLKKESWARTSAIVLGILMLFSFPIGTFIGIITIYFLVFNREVIRMFR
ncbi:hypothetical protein HYV49_01865 [Candidatus Pacearchaeota archaeon]|nr:hypothetical protein [Candidatus Pacearchaeota archaeon]